MKARALIIISLSAVACFSACEKNKVSKVPNITLIAASNEIKTNVDTMAIQFKIIDGDADLGNDSLLSGVYWKDSRYDSAGFTRADFPYITPSLEDPNKGIEAICTFFPVPQPTPRLDSMHIFSGDTMTYELYVQDRAGNKSNHITTPTIIITP